MHVHASTFVRLYSRNKGIEDETLIDLEATNDRTLNKVELVDDDDDDDDDDGEDGDDNGRGLAI
jgi:hypothetical protein